MKIRMRFYSIIASLILIAMLYSCGTSASNFYILTPNNNYQQINSNSESDISIGIGSLEFPDYLLKPQIVTYTENNEIFFDEYNRWAEPLDENFTHIVLENLSNMIPTNNIYLFMWPEEKSNIFQITIKIDQFGMSSDSTVVLDARWTVSTSNEMAFLMTEKSSYQERIANLDYNQIAAAMSKLTGEFCKDIAAEVKERASNN
ncbi:MAG: membrane integrity-associated transporter subunit PqiC [Melioribacteraceae bacterium]|nr:membrane integrity-associated transporter subunit PqiC [Melioribacteraceae bacterium]